MDGALVHDGWGLPEWVVKLRRRLRMDGQFFPKQPIQFEGRGKKISVAPISIDYVTGTGSLSNASSYTFSSVSIGAASADRVVIVAVGGTTGSTPAINSVTIGGNTATLAASQASTSAAGCIAGLYYLAVASGTTANIVVTFNKTMGSCEIAVFSMTGHASETPAATGTDGTGSTTFNPNCNVAVGDVLISASNGGEGTACAWTNSTEQSDVVREQTNLSTAKHTATSAETPRTITATHTASFAGCAVSAAWR